MQTRLPTKVRVCIDYRKLNVATRKDHFPLPFIDQMLERLAGHEYYSFLDGYSMYNQILIAPEDQEKTTFTCPFGTFAYRRMPFGLCMQCPHNIPMLHVKPFLRHSRMLLWDLHGQLLHLWRFIWLMSTSLRTSAKKVHWKVPLYGAAWGLS